MDLFKDKTEGELRSDVPPGEWIHDFLDNQLGAVIIYSPVWNELDGQSTLVDFEVSYYNKSAEVVCRHHQELLLLQERSTTPEATGSGALTLLHGLRHTWESGKKSIQRYFYPAGGQYYQVICSCIRQGVLAVLYDVTAEVLVQMEKDQQVDLVSGILNASVAGVFAMEAVHDAAGDITDFQFVKVNKQFATVIGKPEEEIIGNSYRAVLPGATSNGLFQLKCAVVESRKTISREIYYEGDGIDRWFSISVSPLGNNGVVETLIDITESKRDRQEVERSAQRLQTVISTSQSGVHMFQPVFDESGEIIDFRMTMVNQTVGDYIGQTAETLTGALASKYFPAYMTNGIFDIYKDCYLNGTRHHFDFHYEDGYDVFFNLLVVKLDDEVLVTLTDHTALKRMQRDLEASIAELKRSNASLEQFAHAASHDLQEPLRKVLIYTDKLLSEYADDIDDAGYGLLERIRTASKRMHRLVKDLLVFAEVGANRNTFEEVDLNKLVGDVLTDLEVAIAERDARISVGPLSSVKGDSIHLQQLFQNLISNALKYSRHDTPPEIRITSSLKSGKETGLPLSESEIQQSFHVLELKDNGQGFSAEEAKQIFKIFQRLPQHRNEHSGTGIGLAIVQRVVENHKGYITAEGVPGSGATFRIYLPAQ